MKLIKTNNSDFYRDQSNYALINTNANAYKQYKLQRNNKSKLLEQEAVISNLSSEIEELKKLVKQLVEKKNG